METSRLPPHPSASPMKINKILPVFSLTACASLVSATSRLPRPADISASSSDNLIVKALVDFGNSSVCKFRSRRLHVAADPACLASQPLPPEFDDLENAISRLCPVTSSCKFTAHAKLSKKQAAQALNGLACLLVYANTKMDKMATVRSRLTISTRMIYPIWSRYVAVCGLGDEPDLGRITSDARDLLFRWIGCPLKGARLVCRSRQMHPHVVRDWMKDPYLPIHRHTDPWDILYKVVANDPWALDFLRVRDLALTDSFLNVTLGEGGMVAWLKDQITTEPHTNLPSPEFLAEVVKDHPNTFTLAKYSRRATSDPKRHAMYIFSAGLNCNLHSKEIIAEFDMVRIVAANPYTISDDLMADELDSFLVCLSESHSRTEEYRRRVKVPRKYLFILGMHKMGAEKSSKLITSAAAAPSHDQEPVPVFTNLDLFSGYGKRQIIDRFRDLHEYARFSGKALRQLLATCRKLGTYDASVRFFLEQHGVNVMGRPLQSDKKGKIKWHA